MNRLPTVAKGLGSALLLVLILVGMPVVLVRIGAFPRSLPDPATLWRVATGPDTTGRALFAVLAALAWLAWATFTLSVLRETAAAVRTHGLRPGSATARVGLVSPSGRRPDRRHPHHARHRASAHRHRPASSGRRPPPATLRR